MPRTAALLVLAVLLQITAACQPRMPVTRIEAASAARNWCLRDGHPWGDPVETTGPGEPEADGRRWWTARFHAEPGEKRVVQVNADTGWVRLAP